MLRCKLLRKLHSVTAPLRKGVEDHCEAFIISLSRNSYNEGPLLRVHSDTSRIPPEPVAHLSSTLVFRYHAQCALIPQMLPRFRCQETPNLHAPSLCVHDISRIPSGLGAHGVKTRPPLSRQKRWEKPENTPPRILGGFRQEFSTAMHPVFVSVTHSTRALHTQCEDLSPALTQALRNSSGKFRNAFEDIKAARKCLSALSDPGST